MDQTTATPDPAASGDHPRPPFESAAGIMCGMEL